MMAPGPDDDGSVFPDSAQNVSNLVIDGDYICRAWWQFRIVLVSRCPSASGDTRLELCLILWIVNEDLKCSESRVALCVKHTLQKKVSCLQQVSLFNRVISRSNLGLTRITIRVSGSFGSVYWPGFNPGQHYHYSYKTNITISIIS